MNETAEYVEIVRLYGNVVDSRAGFKPSDEPLVDAQSLALKLFEHAAAIYSLAQGVEMRPLTGKRGHLFPYSSVDVLARAIFEGYLTFFYVFLEPKTEDEVEFRYCVWKLRALTMREKSVADFPLHQKGTVGEQMEFLKEQLEIHDSLRTRIQDTDIFKKLKPKKQKEILREGKWLFPRWVDIAESAGIGEGFAQAAYRILSDQAHSGGLSALQMGTLSAEERTENIQSTLGFMNAIVARMTLSYAEKFPGAKNVLENNPGTTKLAVVYAGALSIVK